MDTLKDLTVFSPSSGQTKGRRGPLMPIAFVDRITVPVLPANTSDDNRMAYGFLLMCCGTSESTSAKEWKTYVAAYTATVAPGLVARFPGSSYLAVPMTDTQVAAVGQSYIALKTAVESGDVGAVTAEAVRIGASPIAPGLPKINSALDWTEAEGEWITKILICHYSIVLFAAGKRIEGTDHSALSKARPEALRKKAHFPDICGFLDGPLRLSDTSHLQINNAWAEMSGLRALVITEFSRYSQSETDFSQDLIFTTMHLLRFSGMQHARLTMDFLRAYPWAFEIPALRGPISIYIESIRAAARYDEGIQPFIKLIYGDKAAVFPRKDLEPLVACAVACATEASEALRDFYVSNDYSTIVEAFLEERERRQKIRDGELLLKEQTVLGGLDEFTTLTPETEV